MFYNSIIWNTGVCKQSEPLAYKASGWVNITKISSDLKFEMIWNYVEMLKTFAGLQREI